MVAYNERLADRIRKIVARGKNMTEKKMFGGLAFLLDGKMFCGIVKDDMMVRVGPEQHEKALQEKGARPMDFTGRPMKGYIFVGQGGYKTDDALSKWVKRGAAFVAGMPKAKRAP